MTGLPEIRTVAYWIFGILLAGGVLVITENVKELIKQAGGTTLLVRIVDTIVPERLRARLSWKYLHAAWWLWIIFGLSCGVALGFWLRAVSLCVREHKML
jgi:hypothetical protein